MKTRLVLAALASLIIAAPAFAADDTGTGDQMTKSATTHHKHKGQHKHKHHNNNGDAAQSNGGIGKTGPNDAKTDTKMDTTTKTDGK